MKAKWLIYEIVHFNSTEIRTSNLDLCLNEKINENVEFPNKKKYTP